MFAKTYTAENSRRHKRLRANYLIKYQIAGSKEEPFLSNMKDVSRGGVRFWTDFHFSEGTLLKVSLFVPALDRAITALGRVLRIRKARHADVYYMAVGFIEMPQQDQDDLDRLIENISRKSYGKKLVDDSLMVKREVNS